MRIVLDTNVLVAGLLNPYGAPGRIVDMVAAGELTVCFDARIISEYRKVLSRSKFAFQVDEVGALLAQIQASGEPAAPRPLAKALPDSTDEPFLEVAIDAGADYLVTGNARHYPARCRRGIRLASPRKFVDICRQLPEIEN